MQRSDISYAQSSEKRKQSREPQRFQILLEYRQGRRKAQCPTMELTSLSIDPICVLCLLLFRVLNKEILPILSSAWKLYFTLGNPLPKSILHFRPCEIVGLNPMHCEQQSPLGPQIVVFQGLIHLFYIAVTLGFSACPRSLLFLFKNNDTNHNIYYILTMCQAKCFTWITFLNFNCSPLVQAILLAFVCR